MNDRSERRAILFVVGGRDHRKKRARQVYQFSGGRWRKHDPADNEYLWSVGFLRKVPELVWGDPERS